MAKGRRIKRLPGARKTSSNAMQLIREPFHSRDSDSDVDDIVSRFASSSIQNNSLIESLYEKILLESENDPNNSNLPGNLTALPPYFIMKALAKRSRLGFALDEKDRDETFKELKINFKDLVDGLVGGFIIGMDMLLERKQTYKISDVPTVLKRHYQVMHLVIEREVVLRFKYLNKYTNFQPEKYNNIVEENKDENISVPAYIARSISLIGVIIATNMMKDYKIHPTLDDISSVSNEKKSFNYMNYLECLDEWKKLGIPLAAVNHSYVSGSAWWTMTSDTLLNGSDSANIRLTLPEENYIFPDVVAFSEALIKVEFDNDKKVIKIPQKNILSNEPENTFGSLFRNLKIREVIGFILYDLRGDPRKIWSLFNLE